MQDCNDWPVSFLGAMYAGLVPVAVNTLLTADDYAYMLEHSRAQAVLVSGALLPALTRALIKSDHEVGKVIVSRPQAPLKAAPPQSTPLQPGEVEFEAFLAAHGPMAKPAATGADDPGFWLYSSGSTGRPKGTVHSHANPYWTCELYGKRVLGLTERDVCFSAAKLFFAYGLGNALSFPMSVGATVLLMAERPTPDATFKRWTGGIGGRQAHGVLRRADRLRRHARLAEPAQARRRGDAPRVLRRRGAAGRARRALQGALRRRHRRRHRLHRDAAHLHLQPARQGALRHHRLAGARLRDRAARRRRRSGARWRAGRPLHPRPLGRDDVLGQPPEDARHLPGRLDQERRQVHPQRRRQLHLRRPQRRHAQGQRHLRLALRGRGHAGAAPGRARSRGDRRAGCRGPDQDQGLRGAQARRARPPKPS